MIVGEPLLENYTLETELSQNDHFIIYRGRRKADDSAVLVKVVAPLYCGDEFFARRFKQITQQVAQLEHPNILPGMAAEQQADLLFFSQDFVEAPTLAEIIESEGPFSPQRIQFIAAQIASALDYAHQKGVMHGDLSANHIYLLPNDQTLIADFGQTQALFGANVIKNSHAITSPETLAPERVHGQGPSRPADLYALGILCYQMLAQKPPFTGPTSSILHAHTHHQPRPLYQVNARVSVNMSKVIERMLAKGVELRYNTGAEFIRALEMTRHTKRMPSKPYTHLTPITEREHEGRFSLQIFFYASAGMMIILFVAVLFAWAGYELGLRQVTAQVSPTEITVTTTIPLPTRQNNLSQLASPTATAPEIVGPLPTPTEVQTFTSFTDTLLPTPTPRPTVQVSSVELISSTISTPAPLPASTFTPTSLPAMPVGQGKFIFYNPTGFDLIIDLTGPTPTSKLVPPNQKHEFLLLSGSYQYIVHTLTGEHLETVVATFNLAEGQMVEKDYYSDYDWQ